MPPRRSPNHLRSLTRYASKSASKSAEGLFKWATTDHMHMQEHISRAPSENKLEYIITITAIAIGGALMQGIWIFLLVAFGIPFLLTGSFL